MTVVDPWVRTEFADRCVLCLVYVVTPTVRYTASGQAECLYECPCGWSWECSWNRGAVEGWSGDEEKAAA